METYIIIKAILMAALLAAGFGVFYIRVRKLVLLMLSVKGKMEFKPDRIQKRIKVLFTDILGQSAVQPHSIELMVQGIFHNFSVAHYLPNLFGLYLKLADTLAFFVLIGLGVGLYRRIILKPDYLTNGMDAKLIILFTSVIIISFHFYNGFRLLLPDPDLDLARYFTVSAALASVLNLSELSERAMVTGLEISYWVHMLTIIGFMIYIPGSKHLHLLAAIPNVFLKPLDIEKPMTKTDIEDEEATSFGLGRVSELNWKNVLDLYACTECGRCQERCPANITGKPLSPKELISHTKHELLDHADTIIKGKDLESVPLMIREEESFMSPSTIWSCTTCRACEDICPVNIQHLDIISEARKYQVLMEAKFPPEMQETFANFENQSNPWGFSADTRADWCRDMDVPLMTDNPGADLLYFVGCSGSFDDHGMNISRAIAGILQKADINFAILGPEEKCNGDMARRCGNEYLAQMMIRENVETLNRYKPKKILTGCPHCYNIIKNEYPQFGANYDVVHHIDFFCRLIKEGRLKINGQNFGNITFHDSCYLGRWNKIYDSSRQLISMINQGKPVIEMANMRDNAMCCGAGGARMFMEETIGRRINNERAKQAMVTKADMVAAACPFCITMLRDGIADNGGDMPVKDVAQILDLASL
ncbi:MAG: (Fe-S)-binding protein [Deltaproteobacteria bacterium]|nr:(Fe-S)-binding protein [Deltaproteobacteria bacterium]